MPPCIAIHDQSVMRSGAPGGAHDTLAVNSAGMLLSLVLFVAGSSVSEVGRMIQLVRGGAGPQIQLLAVREWCDACVRPGTVCVHFSVCRRAADGRIAD